MTICFLFVFFKQKTAYEMRISDWSSDVCSSDLAPLNSDVGLFFQSLGLTLLQGYGQTEASPVISCNRPGAGIRMDTVGPPMKGVEVRIAEDGEILVRGELVMYGYWRNEDRKSTRLNSSH